MTDNTKPEALDLADWLEAVGGGPSAKRCAALLREEQHARFAELEAQIEALSGVQALSAAPATPTAEQAAPKAAPAQQAGEAAESVPAVEREQERIAFKDAHRHLELYEVPDAWGRPMFKHSHVEASWLGWIARASRGQASSQAGEYPALVCDYCGALTPDPWHSSGMLHGKMSKHIHSCDACAGGETTGATDMTTQQPDALRLTAMLTADEWPGSVTIVSYARECVAELLRQHARIAELEAEIAGGVQALSAAPVAFLKSVIALCSHRGYSPANIELWDKDDKWIADLWRQAESMLAASPTPPAEQQATKETLGGVNGWRDISTAPKDGSRFVATGHNYGLYSEVRHTCVAQWFQGCWMEASDWNETSELKYLTHWMPLPSPPDDVAAPAEQQAAHKAAPVEPSDVEIDDFLDSPACITWVIASNRDRYRLLVRAVLAKWAAPQQEAQEPAFWMNEKGHTWSHSDWKQFPKHRAKYPIPLYPHFPAPQPAPACHHRPPCAECASLTAQGGKV